MKLFARQGDVGFVQRTIPKEAKSVKLRPLALGEVTGHSHQVAVADQEGCEMYDLDGVMFLRVTADGGISIVHDEHGPVTLPHRWEGEIRIANEYDEENDFRVVVD